LSDGYSKALLDRYRSEHAKRERGMPTLPSTIALEKATNPFLRVLEPDIVEAICTHTGVLVTTPSAAFEALRDWKTSFRFRFSHADTRTEGKNHV